MNIVTQLRSLLAALPVKGISLKALLRRLQKFVEADKAVVVGILMQAAAGLAAALKFHLNASGVAVVMTIINLGVSYFLQQNYRSKLAAAKLPKE